MTFKELAMQDLTTPLAQTEVETSVVQAVLANQSPIMKVWFLLMMVNMVLFLFLIN